MYFVKDIPSHGKCIYNKVGIEEYQIAIMRWTDGLNLEIVENIARDAERIVACLNYCKNMETKHLKDFTQDINGNFKSCPFCKSNDIGIYAVPRRYVTGKYKHTVECNKCGGSTGEYYDANEAIRTWDGISG